MSINFLDLDDDDEEEFLLYGIVAPNIAHHQFIFHVNYQLSTRFQIQPDLDVYVKNKIAHFNNYYFYDCDSKNDCHIIINVSRNLENNEAENSLFSSIEERYYLLEKYKRYNFLLKLVGNPSKEPTFALSLHRLSFVYETKILNLTKPEKSLLQI